MHEEISKDVAVSDCILSEKFISLYESTDIRSDYEALTVAFHAFMLESGFIPKDPSDDDQYKCMPKNWKCDGIFKILYQHKCCQSFICCMTCVPLYNTLSVHGILCDIDCSESVNIKVEICKYLKKRRDFSSVIKVFDNYSELLRYFKDNFCLPLLNLVHERTGCIPLLGLHGLLDEIKVYILQLLPVESVISLSVVNKNFNRLVNSPYLWKYFYQRDFAKDGVPDIDSESETNWKELYVKEYVKKKKTARPRHVIFHPNRLPQIFPVGPDYEFDISIGFDPPPPQLFPPYQDFYSPFPRRPPFFFRL